MYSKIILTMLIVVYVIVNSALIWTIVSNRRNRLGFFVPLVMAVGNYMLGCILELLITTMDGAFIAVSVQYTGIPFIAPFFLLFIMEFSKIKFRRVAFVIPLMVLSFGFMLTVFTNGYHHLFFMDMSYNLDAFVPQLITQKGVLFYANMVLSGVIYLIALWLMIVGSRKWSDKQRKDSIIPVVGTIIVSLATAFAGFFMNSMGSICIPFILCFMVWTLWESMHLNSLYDIVPKAFEIAVQSMPDGILLLDSDKKFIEANEAALVLFPRMQQMQTGALAAASELWPKELQVFGKYPDLRYLKISLERNNSTRHYEVNLVEIVDKPGTTGWMYMLHDITDSEALLMRLEDIAYFDMLTGVYNRRYFIETAAKELERSRRGYPNIAIMMIDIDHFKKVNDTYGHNIGDQVLKAVATQARVILRPYDLFARYGGEEFVVLASRVDAESALNLAQRLRESTAMLKFTHLGESFGITISIGVKIITDSSIPLEQAIDHADTALYRAKETGRNRVVIYEEKAAPRRAVPEDM